MNLVKSYPHTLFWSIYTFYQSENYEEGWLLFKIYFTEAIVYLFYNYFGQKYSNTLSKYWDIMGDYSMHFKIAISCLTKSLKLTITAETNCYFW